MRPDVDARGHVPVSIALAVVAHLALVPSEPAAQVAAPVGVETPVVVSRVFSGASRGPSTLDAALTELAAADVVFIGERHDSIPGHRLELLLLQELGARRPRVVLALEMFERDVQEPLDHFLMGHLAEAEFLKDARPWPEYLRDYKPLVDLAIRRDWPVIAANVPRSIAAEVSKAGLTALLNRPERERAWFARQVTCATDGAYFTRFRAALTGHNATAPAPGAAPMPSAGSPADAATAERYFQAQCLKDETMAESIAQAHAAGAIGGARPLVVSVAGAFHSEFGDGIVSATRRRLPDRRLVTVTIVPTADVAAASPDAAAWAKADYLIYVQP